MIIFFCNFLRCHNFLLNFVVSTMFWVKLFGHRRAEGPSFAVGMSGWKRAITIGMVCVQKGWKTTQPTPLSIHVACVVIVMDGDVEQVFAPCCTTVHLHHTKVLRCPLGCHHGASVGIVIHLLPGAVVGCLFAHG